MSSVRFSSIVPKDYILPFILVTALFFLWGVANNMTDILLATFRKVMSMSDFQTSWIQTAFYGAYFCLALPTALFLQRYSYKAGILLGLGLYGLGACLCYPASLTTQYWHFLFAFYVLAAGCSVLETTANPYILSLGSGERAAQRLNLAQSFNPLGSITGILLGQHVILANLHDADADARHSMSSDALMRLQQQELSAVAVAYVIIGIISFTLLFVIVMNRFPTLSANDTAKNKLSQSFGRLIRNKQWVMGVVAQFFYVGAQIAIWSYTIRYVMAILPVNEQEASSYYLASIVLFSVSRFICTGLLSYISPAKLLSILAVTAALLTLLVMTQHNTFGIYAMVLISVCMSLMFPTIYSIALEQTGPDTKVAASGLVMAILGGAILTAVQGQLSDSFGIHLSFLVPLVSFLVISLYGLLGNRFRAVDLS